MALLTWLQLAYDTITIKRMSYLWIIILKLMTSNSKIHDRLLQEATIAFAEAPLVQLARDSAIYLYTPELKNRLSLLQYYTHLNVYFLERPQSLFAYLKKSPPSTVNLGLYLQSLRALALVYSSDVARYRHLKQLYLVLARLPEVKQRLSLDCTVPEDIALALECLKKAERKQNEELSDLQAQSVAYSKLVLLANLSDHKSQIQVEAMWTQLTNIKQEGRLNGIKVFDLIMGSVMGKGSVELCGKLLLKFQQMLGGDTIVQHLLQKIKDNNYYKQGERLIFRARLATLFQDQNIPSPPNQDILMMLCLMSQQGTARIDHIFPLLTPEMKFLCDVAEMHVDFHEDYVKRCWQYDYEGRTDVVECLWGELAFSSKLEFLNQMILINDFKGFSKLIERHGLKMDLIYHPRIFASLGLLLEWIVDPIHQIISYSQHFPKKSKTLSFPAGSFQQCSQLSNYLFESITQILNIGKSYVFAKKSTFTKFCRIFRSFCYSKDTRIPVQSQPISNKKVATFSANLIKRYLLPAVEYYGNDPSAVFQVDKLMECFRFRVELEIYLHVIREQRLNNLHLAIHYHQKTQEQIRLLNRLSPDATQIIRRMASLMSSHPFSALDPIFKRIELNDNVLLCTIYSAMYKTPYLTKKIAIFYSFLYLFQDSKLDCGKKYTCLVELTRQMLIHERQTDNIVKTIIQYIASRFSNPKEDLKLDTYKKEINYLTDILKVFLPIELQDNFVSRHNNCRYLAAGPYLKAWLMEKSQELYSRDPLRKSLLACNFHSSAKEIVDHYFFYLLLKINNRLIIVSSSLQGQLSVSAQMHDRILTLMLNFINAVHLQMSAQVCQRYLGIKIFKALINQYKMPYQLAFYLIRKNITHRMQQEGYELISHQVWDGLKSDLQGPLQAILQENTQLKQFQPNSYARDTIKSFFRTDIFLLFWIQDIEYAHFNYKIYEDVLTAIKTGYFKVKHNEQMLQRITLDIANECKRNGECYSKLRDGKTKRVDYSCKMRCQQGGKQEEILNFAGLLIKYCILPRATLTKSECFYCWQFYFSFLFENKYPTVVTIRLLCLLLQAISSYITFSTLRQASELLPLLYNSAAAAVKWKGQPQCIEKISKRGLVSEKITQEIFEQLDRIVYQSQNQVIRLLFDNKGMEEFSVKNCLHFVSACKSIPCYKEQADTIVARLIDIKQTYEESSALATMVDRLATDIDLRSTNIRSFIKIKTPAKQQTQTKCFESIRRQSYESDINDIPLSIDVESTFSNASAFIERSKKKEVKAESSMPRSKKIRTKSKAKSAKKDILNMTIK